MPISVAYLRHFSRAFAIFIVTLCSRRFDALIIFLRAGPFWHHTLPHECRNIATAKAGRKHQSPADGTPQCKAKYHSSHFIEYYHFKSRNENFPFWQKLARVFTTLASYQLPSLDKRLSGAVYIPRGFAAPSRSRRRIASTRKSANGACHCYYWPLRQVSRARHDAASAMPRDTIDCQYADAADADIAQ